MQDYLYFLGLWFIRMTGQQFSVRNFIHWYLRFMANQRIIFREVIFKIIITDWCYLIYFNRLFHLNIGYILTVYKYILMESYSSYKKHFSFTALRRLISNRVLKIEDKRQDIKENHIAWLLLRYLRYDVFFRPPPWTLSRKGFRMSSKPTTLKRCSTYLQFPNQPN